MICAIAVCALLAGSTDKCQPGPQQVQYIKDQAAIASKLECADFFHVLQEILPQYGLSPRRFEFSAPREPNASTPSTNEFLRSK